MPALVAFDLDDTLAPSKQPLPDPMVRALADLLARVPVCLISGGDVSQFRTQVVERMAGHDLTDLHLLPTCGTRYLRVEGEQLVEIYAHELPEAMRSAAAASLERRARELGLWEPDTWGDIIEDRGTQMTFSALGQRAPVDAKKAWDPTGEKKERLRAAVAADLPDLEVRSGGSTSVDITATGIDKAYGMERLAQRTGVALADMLFVGDRLDEGGNDRPVLDLGVPCRAVTGWEETVDLVTALVADLDTDGPATS
ncbi:HAD-IIB family hydrolase [Georgenia sp. Z1491]|uniref:HAD-IIB family hydrolase n=1 Tax=Georgenia sp. Z1491 TaxID=3416707 RepID=UPI003CF0FB84